MVRALPHDKTDGITVPDSEGVPSLHKTALRGTAWVAAGKYGFGIIQTLIMAVLSRLLTPADFGLVAMVVVVTAYVNVFAEAGVGSTVVQKRDLRQGALSSVFWLSVGVATILTAGVFLLAPLVADFYGMPAATPVLRALSAGVFLVGVTTVPLGILRRNLEFRKVAMTELASVLLSGTVAIVLAVSGYGYWALVAQSLIFAVSKFMAFLILSRWRPSIHLRLGEVREVLGYSSGVVGFNTINYWARNADNLLIGKFVGAQALGFYSLAYRLMMLPLTALTGVVNPVLHPVLATIQSDVPRMRRGYLRVTELIALLSVPIAATLWVVAYPLVHVVWGPGWEPSAGVFKVLACLSAVQPVVSTTGTVFLARDATALLMRVGSLNALVMIAGIAAGLSGGIVGVAIGYATAYFLFVLPYTMHTVLGRLLGGGLLDFGRAMLRPLGAGATALAAGYPVLSLVEPHVPESLALLITLVTAGAATLVYIRLVAWELVVSFSGRGGPARGVAAFTGSRQ